MNAEGAFTVEVNAKVQWTFYRDEMSRRWIAVCDALQLVLEADTTTELREDIEDAIKLLMRNLLRANELDRFLRARGWEASNMPPASAEGVEFDVPFELIQRNGNDSQRARH